MDDALASVADADDHVRDFRAWALGTALLRGRTGAAADLTFVDGTGATIARQITRAPESGLPVRFGNLPTLFALLEARPVERSGRTIGVIGFNVWMTAISRQLDEAVDRFRASKGIVLDLRGNPGGVIGLGPYEAVNRADPRSSRATTYNNLRDLVQAGPPAAAADLQAEESRAELAKLRDES